MTPTLATGDLVRLESASRALLSPLAAPDLNAWRREVIETAGVASLPSPEAVRDRLGLSAREAEVALLLAEGLSNADVAGRLFIAPATARRPTENVLGKLGLWSRAAVASALLNAA